MQADLNTLDVDDVVVDKDKETGSDETLPASPGARLQIVALLIIKT